MDTWRKISFVDWFSIIFYFCNYILILRPTPSIASAVMVFVSLASSHLVVYCSLPLVATFCPSAVFAGVRWVNVVSTQMTPWCTSGVSSYTPFASESFIRHIVVVFLPLVLVILLVRGVVVRVFRANSNAAILLSFAQLPVAVLARGCCCCRGGRGVS